MTHFPAMTDPTMKQNKAEESRGDDGSDCTYTMEEEWRIVAMTIDFLLFIIYVLIFIIGTLLIFAHAKYVGDVKHKLQE